METIQQAKDHLKDKYEKGCRCPVCDQYVKLYKRKIYDSMAVMLVSMYVNYFINYVHISGITKSLKDSYRGADFSKLAYWDLIEAKEKNKERTGVKSDGFWRITSLGEDFIIGQATMPKYVLIYNGKRIDYEGPRVKIWDCFKKKFDYQELMGSDV